MDQVAADRPFYSGKHWRHGMNLQVIATPAGTPCGLRSAARAAHDLTATRIRCILQSLAVSGLMTLADEGCHGAGEPVLTRYRGKNKPEFQKHANHAHAWLRSLGERANSQLKT